MQHPDEGTIHAWLDGALPDEEARAVGEHVASCAACGERVAEARGMVAAASRILSALDDAPAGVVPGRARRPMRAPRAVWWRRPAVGMAAAMMIVALGTTMVVTRNWQGTRVGVSESVNPALILADSQASGDSTTSVSLPPFELERDAADMSVAQEAPSAPQPPPRMARHQSDAQVPARVLPAPTPQRAAEQSQRELAESAVRAEAAPPAAKAISDSSVAGRRYALIDSIPVVRVDSLAIRPQRAAQLETEATVASRRRESAGAPAVVGSQTLTRTAASLAGCYSLELRGAGGHTAIDLPSTVELAASTRDAAEAANQPIRQGFTRNARPLMVPPAIDTGQLGWRMASDDSVAVRLASEGRAVLLTFPAELTEPQLGHATTQELPGFVTSSSPVLVQRVPCP